MPEGQILIDVRATVAPEQVDALHRAFEALLSRPAPDGLLRNDLLRGMDGSWHIHSLWRDLDSLRALRAAGEPPAVLALLDALGAEHSHELYAVEQSRSL